MSDCDRLRVPVHSRIDEEQVEVRATQEGRRSEEHTGGAHLAGNDSEAHHANRWSVAADHVSDMVSCADPPRDDRREAP